MNDNQEMQFADPAWQPRVTQDLNQVQETLTPQPVWTPAPGAERQDGEAEPDYAQGYQGYRTPGTQAAGPDNTSQSQQQQPYSQPQQAPPRHIPNWVWVLIFVVLLGSVGGGSREGPVGSLLSTAFVLFLIFLGWLIFTGKMRVNLSGETQPAETHTFEVSAQPTVLINNKAGSIRLRAGQEGQVSVTTTRRGYLFRPQSNTEAQIGYSQDSVSNTVSARVNGGHIFGKNIIDFDVVVPPQATLELITNAGNVSVQNVAGRMKLKSDAGSINATQVTLQGRSLLKTDAGSITFSGSLAATGDYEFSTDLGSVNATLPIDASFDLDAKTDLGSINTNFSLAQQQRSKAQGQVGTGPSYPRLKVRTDLGSVKVFRG